MGWAEREGEREMILHFPKRFKHFQIKFKLKDLNLIEQQANKKNANQHEMHTPIFLIFILWLNNLFNLAINALNSR